MRLFFRAILVGLLAVLALTASAEDFTSDEAKKTRSSFEKMVADGGPPVEKELLANLYLEGYGGPVKYKEARLLLEQVASADALTLLGDYSLGRIYAEGLGVQKNPERGLAHLRKAAEKGHAEAAVAAADMLFSGEGAPPDEAQAYHYYQQAADQGYIYPMYILGRAYWYGTPVLSKDRAKAFPLLLKAAEGGLMQAQNTVGLAYLEGEYVEKNVSAAIGWFLKAAAQNDMYAQYNLGRLYGSGEGVDKNDAESVRYLRPAAEAGHSGAQFLMGVAHDIGKGAEVNPKESVRWYRLAAKQGHATAQLNLGLTLLKGQGEVKADPKQAHEWLERAAANGQEKAKAALQYLAGEQAEREDNKQILAFQAKLKAGSHTHCGQILEIKFDNALVVTRKSGAVWFPKSELLPPGSPCAAL